MRGRGKRGTWTASRGVQQFSHSGLFVLLPRTTLNSVSDRLAFTKGLSYLFHDEASLQVKLCDFGITRAMDRSHLTATHGAGSPRYMAPEVSARRGGDLR